MIIPNNQKKLNQNRSRNDQETSDSLIWRNFYYILGMEHSAIGIRSWLDQWRLQCKDSRRQHSLYVFRHVENNFCLAYWGHGFTFNQLFALRGIEILVHNSSRIRSPFWTNGNGTFSQFGQRLSSLFEAQNVLNFTQCAKAKFDSIQQGMFMIFAFCSAVSHKIFGSLSDCAKRRRNHGHVSTRVP